MTDTTTTAPESMQYRTEVKQLLNILAHSLYTDREIFLRELISNASDALNRIQFELLTNHDVLDHDRELAIWLETDREAHTLTIRDSGIGMTHDELIENLGTIAHSGAKTFLANAQEKQATLEEIIGQFGVGFYSVFMVAEQVSVTSRSFLPDAQAWTWTSSGESDFTLTPADKADRGTTIVITLKHEGDEDAADFADNWRIEQVVKKHSDYVSFPIYLVETKPVRGRRGRGDRRNRDHEPHDQPAQGPVAASPAGGRGRGRVQRILQAAHLRFQRPHAARASGHGRAGECAQPALCAQQAGTQQHDGHEPGAGPQALQPQGADPGAQHGSAARISALCGGRGGFRRPAPQRLPGDRAVQPGHAPTQEGVERSGVEGVEEAGRRRTGQVPGILERVRRLPQRGGGHGLRQPGFGRGSPALPLLQDRKPGRSGLRPGGHRPHAHGPGPRSTTSWARA